MHAPTLEGYKGFVLVIMYILTLYVTVEVLLLELLLTLNFQNEVVFRKVNKLVELWQINDSAEVAVS